MKLTTLLFLAFTSAASAVNSYPHAAQLVWSWYAYQVDLANDPGDRSIGFSCTDWDKDNGRCKGEWKACAGSGRGGSCTFNQFVAQVTGQKDLRDKPLLPGTDQSETRPNILETAKHLHSNQAGEDTRFHNLIKMDTKVFNNAVEGLGTSLHKSRQRLEREGKWNPALEAYFDDADKAARESALARRLVLDENVFPDAEKWFKKNGMQMDLKWDSYPDRPKGRDGQTPRVIDWAKTAASNPDGQANIDKFLARMEGNKAERGEIKSQNRHRAFIDSFERSRKIASGTAC